MKDESGVPLQSARLSTKDTEIISTKKFNLHKKNSILRVSFQNSAYYLGMYVGIQSPLWLLLKVFWPIWRRLSKSPFAKSRSESAKLSKTELLLFHFTDFYRMWIELT